MRLLSLFLFVALIVFGLNHASAQQKDERLADTLREKIKYYNLKNQHGVLYAHFDKNVYTNNENVWFTAYMLNSNTASNNVLSAILVKDDDHSIALEEKFVMQKGIAFGNIFLPYSIKSGNYSFLLYANTIINGKPADVFTQPITIKNTSETSFKATLSLIDTTQAFKADTRKIILAVRTPDAKMVAGATVKYCVGQKQHPILSGNVKTDKTGEYLFQVPVDKLTTGNNIMTVQVTYNKEIKDVKLVLPVYRNAPLVRFYPEGGSLSDGVKSTVGWEVKNSAGAPYKVSGVLYHDDRAIDTIATDSYGMGQFLLTPYKQSKYYVKLLLHDQKDSIYNLPNVLMNHPVISILKAVANDTLNLVIRSKQKGKVYLVVHNYKQCFFVIPVEVSSLERKVKVLLGDIPKGLAEITILDSLQRPCCERLFFAHYNNRVNVEITTDKDAYKTRDKVNVKVNLSDENRNRLSGLVSIACVQANRIEIKNTIDIDSYLYLNHDLGTLPVKENYLGTTPESKSFLENVLLIKGWRRYTWEDAMQTRPADTAQQQDSVNFTGDVTYYNKPLKKQTTLILMKDSVINTAITDSKGKFILNNDQLFMSGDKKVYMYVSGGSTEGYGIKVVDPYESINNGLVKIFEHTDFDNFGIAPQANSEKLAGFEHAIQLKEVKIKAVNDNSLFGDYFDKNTNACGDYVCIFNILNCPNHRNDPRNRPPVRGEMYRSFSDISGTVVYFGCVLPKKTDNVQKINGIYYPMEFYPSDYSQFSPSQPEYLSTIYWKYLSAIPANKELNLSFYTSDITGDFKIIIQGICGNDVTFGEKTISVKKP